MFDLLSAFWNVFFSSKVPAELKKWGWASLAGIGLSFGILFFLAMMSLSFYSQFVRGYLAGGITPEGAGMIITCVMATAVLFFSNNSADWFKDWRMGSKGDAEAQDRLKRYSVYFWTTNLSLLLLLAMDVYANYQGVQYRSEKASQHLKVDDASNQVYNQFQQKIDDLDKKIEDIKKCVACQGGGYLNGERIGWYANGIFLLNAAGKKMLQGLEREKDSQIKLQSDLVTRAGTAFEKGEQKYEQNVEVQSHANLYIVFIGYIIVYLIAVRNQFWADKVNEYARS